MSTFFYDALLVINIIASSSYREENSEIPLQGGTEGKTDVINNDRLKYN